ncbi:MAG: DUF4956 domain-containing protein [Lachnospiraceae bacterium]|nr:DUF4956 domain-containing protein [Lachnospiraceae bacterium]
MKKQDILDWFSGNSESLSVEKILFVLIIALAVAAIIFVTYRITYQGVSYNRKFNVGNVVIVLLTSIIMLMISSNMAISLGMVGALSIVRFRTAIKDPHDTIYIFWAIVEGLCVGAQIYELALTSTIFVALVLLAFSLYSNVQRKYLIIIRGGKELQVSSVNECIQKQYSNVRVRAANYLDTHCEMICEISARGAMKEEVIENLKELPNVKSVNWLLETGENVG